jgi:hypothetical protein
MPIVNVKRVESVEVTPENEMGLLKAEWDQRYGDRPFVEGDEVEFVRTGKQRHIEHFGDDHVGKRGIVCALSDNGLDVKILAISNTGEFVELWTPEIALGLVIPR